MGKDTHFRRAWKKKYDWVTKSPKSEYVAVCLACNGKDLNIKSGAPVLARHADTDLRFCPTPYIISNNHEVCMLFGTLLPQTPHLVIANSSFFVCLG